AARVRVCDCLPHVRFDSEESGRTLRPGRLVMDLAAHLAVRGRRTTAARNAAFRRTDFADGQSGLHAGPRETADHGAQVALGEIPQRFLVERELGGDLLLHELSPLIAV